MAPRTPHKLFLTPLLLLLFLTNSTHNSIASPKSCLSYREAKNVYKGAYLHWQYNRKRQRCWGLTPQRRVYKDEVQPEPIRQEPRIEMKPATMYIPPELVPVNQPPDKVDTMLDRWNILEELRDMRAEAPIYSTFTGPEPDVWPVLEKDEYDILWSIIVVGIAFAIGFAASVAVDRYKLRKRG